VALRWAKASRIPVPPSSRRSSLSRHLLVAHPCPANSLPLIPVPPSSRRASQSRQQFVAHPSPAMKSSLTPVATFTCRASQSRHQIVAHPSRIFTCPKCDGRPCKDWMSHVASCDQYPRTYQTRCLVYLGTTICKIHLRHVGPMESYYRLGRDTGPSLPGYPGLLTLLGLYIIVKRESM
jgi:hypothetical protein